MTEDIRYIQRLKAFCLIAIFAFSLLLRLLGPLNAAGREGYVALCVGNQIIYIPLSELGIGEGETPEPVVEDCQWFSQFHAVVASAEPIEPQAERLLVSLEAAPRTTPEVQRAPTSFLARGPPRLRA